MAEAAVEEPAKTSQGRRRFLAGAALAICFAGAGYVAVESGALLSSGDESPGTMAAQDIDFVVIDPVVISFSDGGQIRHLRFAATLEVERRHRSEVARLTPRVLDVFNAYLRALEPEEITGSGALIRIRAQLLRRLQLIAGKGRVRDLLVTEFVLN